MKQNYKSFYCKRIIFICIIHYATYKLSLKFKIFELQNNIRILSTIYCTIVQTTILQDHLSPMLVMLQYLQNVRIFASKEEHED